MSSQTITTGNYRAERVSCGWAVYWISEPARCLANAIRIVATTDQARAWMSAR